MKYCTILCLKIVVVSVGNDQTIIIAPVTRESGKALRCSSRTMSWICQFQTLERLLNLENFLPLDFRVYPLAHRRETAGVQPLARPQTQALLVGTPAVYRERRNRRCQPTGEVCKHPAGDLFTSDSYGSITYWSANEKVIQKRVLGMLQRFLPTPNARNTPKKWAIPASIG